MSRKSGAEARKSLREFPMSQTRSAAEPSALFDAHENERRRICRELHDEMGQGLMSLRFSLGLLVKDAESGPLRKKAQQALDILDNTIEGLRRIIGRLSPRPLEDLGLLGAIRRETDLLAKRTGMISHVALPKELSPINREIQVAVYRSVQEALHNISKHSGGQNFRVSLQNSAQKLILQISDDGAGFAARSAASLESFGLSGMRDRVNELGGTLRISSLKSGGTRIQVELPAGTGAVQTMEHNARARAS